MIPFVRNVKRVQEVKKLSSPVALSHSNFQTLMMVEIPVNVILLDQFIDVGIDGIFCGNQRSNYAYAWHRSRQRDSCRRF